MPTPQDLPISLLKQASSINSTDYLPILSTSDLTQSPNGSTEKILISDFFKSIQTSVNIAVPNNTNAINITGVSKSAPGHVDLLTITDNGGTGAGIKVLSSGTGGNANAGVFQTTGSDTTVQVGRTATNITATQAVFKIQKHIPVGTGVDTGAVLLVMGVENDLTGTSDGVGIQVYNGAPTTQGIYLKALNPVGTGSGIQIDQFGTGNGLLITTRNDNGGGILGNSNSALEVYSALNQTTTQGFVYLYSQGSNTTASILTLKQGGTGNLLTALNSTGSNVFSISNIGASTSSVTITPSGTHTSNSGNSNVLTIVPSAIDSGQNTGISSVVLHNSGAFNLTGNTYGGYFQVTQNVSAKTMTTVDVVHAFGQARAGTITTMNVFNATQGTTSDAGIITNLNYYNIFQNLIPSGGITTVNGFNIPNLNGTGVTTAIGIDIAAQTGAGTGIGLRIAAGQTYALQLSDTGGTITGGIQFGTDSANLYRNTTNTLKTDGNFSIVGNVGFNNTVPLAEPVLATGAGHTSDDIITVLQNYGLVKQL